MQIVLERYERTCPMFCLLWIILQRLFDQLCKWNRVLRKWMLKFWKEANPSLNNGKDQGTCIHLSFQSQWMWRTNRIWKYGTSYSELWQECSKDAKERRGRTVKFNNCLLPILQRRRNSERRNGGTLSNVMQFVFWMW